MDSCGRGGSGDHRRDPATGALTFDYDVKVRTGVDNIEVDPLGRLLLGCHPRLITLAKHLADPARPSPSQVLKITLGLERPALVEEVRRWVLKAAAPSHTNWGIQQFDWAFLIYIS